MFHSLLSVSGSCATQEGTARSQTSFSCSSKQEELKAVHRNRALRMRKAAEGRSSRLTQRFGVRMPADMEMSVVATF